MHPFLAKPTFVYAVLALLGAGGGFTLYKGQWQSVREIPFLARMSGDDKKWTTDGPIYVLAKVSAQMAAPDEQVLFFNPASGPQGEYYEGKLKYYLFPRRLTSVGPDQSLPLLDLSQAGVALVFEPRGREQAVARQILEKLPFWEKIFEFERDFGYQAIFRNKSKTPTP